MKLLRSRTINFSNVCQVQAEYRTFAVTYAITGIGLLRERNTTLFPADMVFSEFEDATHDWVIETLVQGAYIREYHLWEKDTRQYFAEQVAINNGDQKELDKAMRKVSTDGYVAMAVRGLGVFSAEISTPVFLTLDGMRKKVNNAKHEPGLLIDHFVTQEEYGGAAQTISKFWQELQSQESWYRPNKRGASVRVRGK